MSRLTLLRIVLAALLASSIVQAQEWSRFEWVRVDVGGKTAEKAGIYLPVGIHGLAGKYHMQLDTGSPRTLLYVVPYEQVLREQNAPSPDPADGKSSGRFSHASFTGSIGALDLDHVPVLLYREYGTPVARGDKHPKIGTIGLDLFLERPLILDFPKRRFAVLGKGASIPPELEQRATFFEVTVRDGLVFLPVLHDEQPIGSIFYDTGSSMFPLVTRRSIWQELTGRTGDEPDDEHLTISSWGNRVVMTGARTRKPVRVGPVNVGNCMVYFAPPEAKNLSFEESPSKAVGLVGNASFYDDSIVILDLPRQRMAILKSR